MLNASDYFLLVDGETPNDTPPGEEAEAEQQISILVFAGAELESHFRNSCKHMVLFPTQISPLSVGEATPVNDGDEPQPQARLKCSTVQ